MVECQTLVSEARDRIRLGVIVFFPDISAATPLPVPIVYYSIIVYTIYDSILGRDILVCLITTGLLSRLTITASGLL